MTYVENLIKLYYLYHGSFDNIRTCNFADNINEAFSKSGNDSLYNYLYGVLGYKNSQLYPSSKVMEVRKDFCVNSYKKSYLDKLLKDYSCASLSELVDLLEMRGMLGIQRKHLSVLGKYNNQGIPSKFLNIQIKELLSLIELYLDDKMFKGKFSFTDLKRDLLSKDNVKDVLRSYNINYSDFFTLVYDNSVKSPYIKDDKIYLKKIGNYSEDKLREILVICYCLGLPKMPLYLRDKFIELMPTVLSFYSSDDSLLRIIDISYVCETSVRELLEVFGFTLPDPEVMWKKFNGYMIHHAGRVLYTNPSSNSYIEFDLKTFLDYFNSGKLQTLDIGMELILQENETMKSSNSFR